MAHAQTPEGFPRDPALNALEVELSNLAAVWRSHAGDAAAQAQVCAQYHATLATLYANGWDGLLDGESMLPDAQMPAQYFALHPEARSGPWTETLSRPLGARWAAAAED